MKMKKMMFVTMTLSLILMMNIEKMINMKMVSMTIINMEMNSVMNNINWSLSLEKSSNFFFLMITTVTSLVLLYSEMYMEKYNNKKFFILLMSFTLSMTCLVTSSSLISIITSWEMLGLTSLILIMFYPNNNTMFNSVMTMAFNRLGDACMILFISLMMIENLNNYFLESMSMVKMYILATICSFTKSAQFPLSSWLPAAMSAPTPISAMVHSSTLVTAGIFLIMKMNLWEKMNQLILIISLTSFLMGGSMACFEMDFKKVIAFSTLSQISMMLVFLSMSMKKMFMAHMMLHAFFKSFLFCFSGMKFMENYSDQNYFKMSSEKKKSKISSYLFFSLFSMSGMAFSSSYFTKDLVLENLISYNLLMKLIIMILGSFFTIYYCSKLMNSSKSFMKINDMSKSKKLMNSSFFLIFSIMMIFLNLVFKDFLFMYNYPILNNWEILIIWFIMMMFILVNNMKLTKELLKISMNIYYMKITTYSKISMVMKSKYMNELMISEKYIFKPGYLMPLSKSEKTMYKFNNFNLLNLMFLLFILVSLK